MKSPSLIMPTILVIIFGMGCIPIVVKFIEHKFDLGEFMFSLLLMLLSIIGWISFLRECKDVYN